LETFVNVLITHVQDLKAFCVVVSMLSFNNFLNAFHEMVAHRHTFFYFHLLRIGATELIK
jgi:hypothetical protein